MRHIALTLICLLCFLSSASADNGLITVQSSFLVKETADRLENILNEKGMNVFARINHAAGAQKAGISLRPMELIIFGNPKVGAPLMQCQQSVGIDLPQKALIWEDENGKTWFSYNDPAYLATRHDIKNCADVIKKIETALKNFANMATMSQKP